MGGWQGGRVGGWVGGRPAMQILRRQPWRLPCRAHAALAAASKPCHPRGAAGRARDLARGPTCGTHPLTVRLFREAHFSRRLPPPPPPPPPPHTHPTPTPPPWHSPCSSTHRQALQGAQLLDGNSSLNEIVCRWGGEVCVWVGGWVGVVGGWVGGCVCVCVCGGGGGGRGGEGQGASEWVRGALQLTSESARAVVWRNPLFQQRLLPSLPPFFPGLSRAGPCVSFSEYKQV